MNTSLTMNLASFIDEFPQTDITKEVKEQVKKLYLDYLCVTIAGARSPVSKRLLKYLETTFPGDSTVLGYNTTLNHTHAALINGTSAHALDFDDGYTKGSVHAGSVIFPAVLAVAEKEKKSAKEILDAILIGYEVTIIIASIIHPYSRRAGYHNTPVAGIFGVAAAICSLLDMNKEQIIGTLGNVLSFTSGTFAFLGSGSDIKRLHPGIASMNGILATEITKQGILGPADIFERRFGLFDVYTDGQFNESLSQKPLGESFEILNMYIKTYPCCRQLDSVIDTVKKIKATYANLDLHDIQRIEIGTHHLASQHNHKECISFLDAQLSIPYAVAVSLVDPTITPESFYVDRPDRDIIEEIVKKVEVFEDEECERLYPPVRKSKVTIYTKGNKVMQAFHDKARGENPNPLSFSEVIEKFKVNCQAYLSEKEMDTVIDHVSKLNFLEAMSAGNGNYRG